MGSNGPTIVDENLLKLSGSTGYGVLVKSQKSLKLPATPNILSGFVIGANNFTWSLRYTCFDSDANLKKYN